jgi:hypothetical protein
VALQSARSIPRSPAWYHAVPIDSKSSACASHIVSTSLVAARRACGRHNVAAIGDVSVMPQLGRPRHARRSVEAMNRHGPASCEYAVVGDLAASISEKTLGHVRSQQRTREPVLAGRSRHSCEAGDAVLA